MVMVTQFDPPESKTLRYMQIENRMELWVIHVYISRITILDVFSPCDHDIDPETFTYELDLYSLAIHRMCKYEHFKSRLSKVII